MSKTKISKMTQGEVVSELLREVLPGDHDESLDYAEDRGPRGGLHGYYPVSGTFRPADPVVSRAVREYEGVRHGDSFYYEGGGPGKWSKTTYTGPTFPDTEAVRAVIANRNYPEVVRLVNVGDVRAAVDVALTRYASRNQTPEIER